MRNAANLVRGGHCDCLRNAIWWLISICTWSMHADTHAHIIIIIVVYVVHFNLYSHQATLCCNYPILASYVIYRQKTQIQSITSRRFYHVFRVTDAASLYSCRHTSRNHTATASSHRKHERRSDLSSRVLNMLVLAAPLPLPLRLLYEMCV